MSKESFKDFARLHPSLATSVNNNQTTWQKLYEMYDIYGERSSVWDTFMPTSTAADSVVQATQTTSDSNLKDVTLSDFMNTIKNVDLETVQKGIANIQKTIGLLQDMGLGGATKAVSTPTYEPRPMYRYFED